MKTTPLMLLSLSLALASCTKLYTELDSNPANTPQTSDAPQKLRSSNHEFKNVQEFYHYMRNKYVSNKISPHVNSYNDYGYVGYGYDLFNKEAAGIELESQQNIRLPIFDRTSSIARRFNSFPLNALDTEVRCFESCEEDFHKYIYATSDSISINAGGKWSWLGEASAKYAFQVKKHTNQEEKKDRKDIYSQISASVKSKRVSLNLGSLKTLTPEKYLSNEFYVDYHFLTPKEVTERYGHFVLTNYDMGGKAEACIRYSADSSKESKEMKNEAFQMASFSCSSLFGKIAINASGQSQKAHEEYTSSMKNYSSGHIKITYRGGNIFENFPHDIRFADMQSGIFTPIDLKDWAKSVENNQVLVSINKNGLVPLFKIIREINLYEGFENYFRTGSGYTVDHERIRYVAHNDYGEISFLMYNKYGDAFLLDQLPRERLHDDNWRDKLNIKESPMPFSEDLNVESRYGYMTMLDRDYIDLTPYLKAKDKSKIQVKFCKLTGLESTYEDDVLYIIIHNKENGRKVALRVEDYYAFGKFQFKEPENIEYIKNLNYMDVYAL